MQMVTPSEATLNGICWISSALIGVLIEPNEKPARRVQELVGQNVQGVAVGDVASLGVIPQPILDVQPGPVDPHVLGPQVADGTVRHAAAKIHVLIPRRYVSLLIDRATAVFSL